MSIDVTKVSDAGKEEYFLVADEMGVFQGTVTREGESTGQSARSNEGFLKKNKEDIKKKIQECINLE